MVAAAAGAGHVVLADQVLYMLQENVARNFAERPEVRERIAVRELQWGDAAQTAAVGAPFDLLLGSDLMYVSEHWDLLADTLASLSREGTVCYFATPRKTHGHCLPGRLLGGLGCIPPRMPAVIAGVWVAFFQERQQ